MITASLCPLAQKQLHLFSMGGNLGNTLLDYDLIPRYVHDKTQKCISIQQHESMGPRIISLEDGHRYEIIPATIRKQSSEHDKGLLFAVFPGTRESLIEECLIHFAKAGEFTLEKGEPGYKIEGGLIAVYFTLYQLRNALKQLGKEYRADELREGLEVLNLAKYRYTNEMDRDKLRGYIVSELDSIPNPAPSDKLRSDRIMYVVFEHQASLRILQGRYRSYDAKCSMSMRSPIARFLYKQFTHFWQQANNKGETGCYQTISQNDTILASGCPLSSNATKRKTSLLLALKELSDANIIQHVKESVDVVPIKSARKIVDLEVVIRPTNQFIKQQIEGYRRLQESKALGQAYLAKAKKEQKNLAIE